MDSPDPFEMPTFDELGDPSWDPGPVAWPPPGWDPRVLEAVRWAMIVELEEVIARCAAADRLPRRRRAVRDRADGRGSRRCGLRGSLASATDR